MELYDVDSMPLSNDERVKNIQLKLLNNEKISAFESVILGRDRITKSFGDYNTKSDHVYRVISNDTLNSYLECGFIIGDGENDEYKETYEDGKVYNNNKGVNWYLGGACVDYGDIIIECPADKDYFFPAYDNGCKMALDAKVRFFKSSGYNNPVPVSLISKVFSKKIINNELFYEDITDFIKGKRRG